MRIAIVLFLIVIFGSIVHAIVPQNAGDLNSDGEVDVFDLVLIGLDFGRTSGFSPTADINNDGEVNILDLSTVSGNFGIQYILTDTDGDGIVDTKDNCTEVANEDQRDTDNDGFGNICDPDLNNDGIVDAADQEIFLVSINTGPGEENYNEHADFDGLGQFISGVDNTILRSYLNGPPGPSGIAEVPGLCGNNGVIDEGEDCDNYINSGSNVGTNSCQTLGFGGGLLKCNQDCTFDTSGCAAVPNPMVEVVYPNGGETFEIGSTIPIKWTQANVDSITIGYKWCASCLGDVVNNLPVSVSDSNGTYEWEIPDHLSTDRNFTIYVQGGLFGIGNESDESDGYFNLSTSPTCDNEICELSEDAFTCYPDCKDVPSCTVRSGIPISNPDHEVPIDGKRYFEVEFGNFEIPPSSILHAECGNGGILISQIGLYGSDSLIGHCEGFTNTGPTTITNVAVSDVANDEEVKCSTLGHNDYEVIPQRPAGTPYIEIIEPNGGETYNIGDTVTIEWNQTNVEKVTINFITHPGGKDSIVSFMDVDINSSTGQYQWQLGGHLIAVKNFRIEILGSRTGYYGSRDISDGPFFVE